VRTLAIGSLAVLLAVGVLRAVARRHELRLGLSGRDVPVGALTVRGLAGLAVTVRCLAVGALTIGRHVRRLELRPRLTRRHLTTRALTIRALAIGRHVRRLELRPRLTRRHLTTRALTIGRHVRRLEL